jgi:SulP family sulfate permease
MPSGLPPAAALAQVAERLPQSNPAALAVGAATIVLALALRRVWPRSPHLLLGMVAGTAVAWGLAHVAPAWPAVETVGAVPRAWPHWQWPSPEGHGWRELAGLALALAVIALGQSYAIAKVLAERSGQYVDANREFVGQGLSNIAGGLFSCYLSCGSLNRSLPNFEAGARTPLASVFAALWLLALVGLSAALLATLPLAAVAGLLLLVAWSLLDVAQWRRLFVLSRLEFGIALATLVATLTIRLEFAILFGAMLSLAAYLWRTARPAMRTMGFDTPAPRGRSEGTDPSAPARGMPDDLERPFVIADDNPRALPECPQLKLLRMEGSVYFGATQHVAERLHALRQCASPQRHLLVMAKSMNFIDLAGDELWRAELRLRRAIGGDLYFHRPRPSVTETWQRTGFIDELGRDHIYPDKRTAIAAIVPLLDAGICGRCTVKLFEECPR